MDLSKTSSAIDRLSQFLDDEFGPIAEAGDLNLGSRSAAPNDSALVKPTALQEASEKSLSSPESAFLEIGVDYDSVGDVAQEGSLSEVRPILPQEPLWEEFVICPGDRNGFGRQPNGGEKEERRDLELERNLAAVLQREQLKQSEDDKSKKLLISKQIQKLQRQKREAREQDVNKESSRRRQQRLSGPGQPEAHPAVQEFHEAHIPGEQFRVPVQRITAHDFVIHPPARPDVAIYRIGDPLHPQPHDNPYAFGLHGNCYIMNGMSGADVARLLRLDPPFYELVVFHPPENFSFQRYFERVLIEYPDPNPPKGNALTFCMERQRYLRLLPPGVEVNEELRRLEVLQQILDGLYIRNQDAVPDIFENIREVDIRQQNHRTGIVFAELAINKIKPAEQRFESEMFEPGMHIEDDDALGCTFCLFESDFGIFDERVWLDPSCSTGYCEQCHHSTNSLPDAWIDVAQINSLHADQGVRDIGTTTGSSRVSKLIQKSSDNMHPLREFIERGRAAEKSKHPQMRDDRLVSRQGSAMNGNSTDSNHPVERISFPQFDGRQASGCDHQSERSQVQKDRHVENLHPTLDPSVLVTRFRQSEKNLPNDSRKGNGSPFGATNSLSQPFGSNGPKITARRLPALSTPRQDVSTSDGGKNPYLARQSTIKHELDIESITDDSDEDEVELQAHRGGKQHFGLDTHGQTARSPQTRRKEIALANADSRQRIGNSLFPKSSHEASSAATANNSSNIAASTPTLKRTGSSPLDSSEPSSKKARRKEPRTFLSLAEELAHNPDLLIPAPPVPAGLTVQQITMALSDGAREAKSKGIKAPRSVTDVIEQGLVKVRITPARQRKFDEALQRYRSYYGNRYEEQQAKFTAEGREIPASPWKVPAKSKQEISSTGDMNGLPQTPELQKASDMVSADKSVKAGVLSLGKKTSTTMGHTSAETEARSAPGMPLSPLVRRLSSGKHGIASGVPSAKNRPSGQSSNVAFGNELSGVNSPVMPMPKQRITHTGNRADASSKLNQGQGMDTEGTTLLPPSAPSAPSTSQQQNVEGLVKKFDRIWAPNDQHIHASDAMAKPLRKSTSLAPLQIPRASSAAETSDDHRSSAHEKILDRVAHGQEEIEAAYRKPWGSEISSPTIGDPKAIVSPSNHKISRQSRITNRDILGGFQWPKVATGGVHGPGFKSHAAGIHVGPNSRDGGQASQAPQTSFHQSGRRLLIHDRHQVVGQGSYIPRRPSNLRQSQIQSPTEDNQQSASHRDFPSYTPDAHNGSLLLNQSSDSNQNFRKQILPTAAFPANEGMRAGILFCRGCPWSQIDITKARICESCRATKLAIIGDRHYEFSELSKLDATDSGYFPANNNKSLALGKKLRMCMICPGRAAWVCRSCPLRLCESCKPHMVNLCKGKVENLLKHFYRMHVRNDAFLLRSDGGGF